jgi:hypothetical protein
MFAMDASANGGADLAASGGEIATLKNAVEKRLSTPILSDRGGWESPDPGARPERLR